MATITAITSSGTPLNVLDPNTWIGGVVPGPGDTAVFPDHPYQQRVYCNTAPDWQGDTNQFMHPWPATEDGNYRMRLFGNAGFPAVSGSVLVRLLPNPDKKYIKIDYDSLTGASTNTYLQNLRIDRTTNNDFIAPNWFFGTGSLENPDSLFGYLYYNNLHAIPYSSSAAEGGQAGPMMYELTGSGVWSVGKVHMGDHNTFTIKDQSKIQLCDSSFPAIDFHTPSAFWSALSITDEATVEVSSSGANIVAGATNGIYLYQRGLNCIEVSGSANYSSSILTQTITPGNTTIEIQDSTAFDPGDYVSIQNRSEYYASVSLSGSNPLYHYYTGNVTAPIGSYQDRKLIPAQTYTGTPDTDEVVRIESISGSTAVISKKLGYEGLVTHDLGVFTHREYAQTFQERVDYYADSKRVILADTHHHAYKKGDWLCISGSAYRVLHVSSYLTQSQFIDFTDPGVDPKKVLVNTEYQYSGSDMPVDVTPPTWDDIYFRSQKMTSGSRAGIHSFFLDSSSMSNTSQIASYLRGGFIVSGSYFKEGEIEISGSLSRDFTGTPDGNDVLGISWNVYPSQREDTNLMYGSINVQAVPRNANVVNVDGQSRIYVEHAASSNAAYECHISADGSEDIYNDTDFYNQFESFWNAGEQVRVKVVVRDRRAYVYVQDVLVGDWWEAESMGAVSIFLRKYASLFSISIKDRRDLLVLDTTDSVLLNETIREGGLLETHEAGKEIKWYATEIDDELGFHNLMWDYWKQRGQTGIMPYLHSWTNPINTVPSTLVTFATNLYANDFFDLASMQYPRAFGQLPANSATVDGTWIVIDLGCDVTFDTVAVGMGSTAQSLVEGSFSAGGYRNIMRNVSIQVSSTPDSWVYVRTAADDTRMSAGNAALRFYTFSGGPVTARFIKFAHTGGKLGTTNNTTFKNFNFFGVYDQSTYPNQIQVKSTKNLRVGDNVTFWSKQYGAMAQRDMTAQSYGSYVSFGLNLANLYNDYYTVGHTLHTEIDSYIITNISGSIITLNRPISTHYVGKGTMVIKLNRGNVSLTGNGPFDCCDVYYSSTQGVKTTFEHCYIKGRIWVNNTNNTSTNIVTLRNLGSNNVKSGTGFLTNSVISQNSVLDAGISATYVYSTQSPQATVLYNTHMADVSANANTVLLTQNASTILNNNVFLRPTNTFGYDVYAYTRNSVREKLSIKNNFIWGFENHSILPTSIFDDGISLNTTYTNNVSMHVRNATNLTGTITSGFTINNSIYNKIAWLNQYQWPSIIQAALTRGKMDGYSINYGKISDGTLYRDGILSANTPTIHIGGYSYATKIIKNGDWYDVYPSILDKVGDYNTVDLMCLFEVKQACTASVDLSFDYDISQWQRHARLDAASYYYFYESTLPIISVVDDHNQSDFGKIIGRAVAGNTSPTGSLNYFETFNFEPGYYRVLMNWSTQNGSSLLGHRAWSYKNMNFNILTNNVNDILVSKNTWDIHKLLDSVIYDVNDFRRPTNIGAPTVVQATNDVATAIKLNKVKL